MIIIIEALRDKVMVGMWNMSLSRLQRSFIPLSVTIISRLIMDFSASYFGSGSPFYAIRWIVGLFFIMFVPGYCLVEAVFPETERNKFDRIERFVLNLGLGLMTTLLALLVLNIFWTISLFSVVITLSLIDFILSFSVLYRDVKLLMTQPREDQGKSIAMNKTGGLVKRLRGCYGLLREYYDLVLPLAVLLVALFSFVIRPFFMSSSATYTYTFTYNTNEFDSVLLLIGAFALLVILSIKKGNTRLLCYVAIAVSIFVAVKSRMYPSALVTTGLAGNRWGVDSWDAIGHINFVLKSGHSTPIEPFLLYYNKGGEITQAYDGLLAPGYFILMAAMSLVTGLSSLEVLRFVCLFSVLDVITMFVLVKRRTGDDAQAVFSAFLIAGGSLMNLLIQFSNGLHSPTGVVAFPLILFGLYLLTFKRTRFTYTLWIWLTIILFNFHYVTGAIYLLIILLLGSQTKVSLRDIRAFLGKVRVTKTILQNVFVIALFGVMAMYVLFFWVPTFKAYSEYWMDPRFGLVVHHQAVGPESPWELTLFQPGDSLYFFLALYGLVSSLRKRDTFFASWLFALFSLWIFLIFLSPLLSYRVIAYIFQAGCAAGGSAIISDFLYRPLSTAEKSSTSSSRNKIKNLLNLKTCSSILIIFTVLYLAIFPVFVRDVSQSPLGLFSQGSMAGTELKRTAEEEIYLNTTFWAVDNLPEDSVIILPPYTLRGGLAKNTVLDHVVSTIRSLGLSMLVVPSNLSLSDFYTISGMYDHAYLLVSDNFPASPAINSTMVREVYSSPTSWDPITESFHWVKLYKLDLP